MQAVILKGVNEPLTSEEVETPKPSSGEARVKILASALNHRDVWIQKGQYAGLKFPLIPGSDGCGIVEAVGSDTDSKWVGKSVIINPSLDWGENPAFQQKSYRILGLPDPGTFAESVVVPTSQLVDQPAHLTPEQSAALPLAGLTAYRALQVRGPLASSHKVLITGIGGGVAQFALQFAKAQGCRVFVTSGEDEKLEIAQKMGAEAGINYKQADWHKQVKSLSGGIDVAIDGAGGAGINQIIDILNPGGRLTVYGATRGNAPEIDMRKIFWKQLNLSGSTMGNADDFAKMVTLVNDHQIIPKVDQVFPFGQAEQAFRFMDEGKQFGKIVLNGEF